MPADVPLGARQPAWPARAAADPRGRDELADVLERPPVERRILPVAERDQLSRTGNGGTPVISW